MTDSMHQPRVTVHIQAHTMVATRLRPFVALDGPTIPHWSQLHASRWGSAIAILQRRSSRLLSDEVSDAAAPELDEDGVQAVPLALHVALPSMRLQRSFSRRNGDS